MLLLQRNVLKDQVYEILRAEIIDGGLVPGTKLPSLKVLAGQFGTSTFTIRAALDRLEEQRLIERRHGSGTYVCGNRPEFTITDSVVLAMHASGHVFGDLNRMLLAALHDRSRLLLPIDIAHADCDAMLSRALGSDADVFLVHGNTHFPFSLLKPCVDRKTVIGVLHWHCHDMADVHRVVIDEAAAGQLVADYLWQRGHRHVLMAGTENMVTHAIHGGAYSPQYGQAFVDEWHRRGGSVQTLISKVFEDGEIEISADMLKAALRPSTTAVFGLRDVETWQIQNLLLQGAVPGVEPLDLMGFGDTPWSRAAQPPFTTVNLNLQAVVEATVRVLDQLRDEPELPPQLVKIEPVLVERERARPTG